MTHPAYDPTKGSPITLSNPEASKLIPIRHPFTNHGGSFRGQAHSPGIPPQRGYLPIDQSRDISHADYLIYSYGTPIAWHDSRTGAWIVPDVKYSVTTSRHQGIVRRAVPNHGKV